jgi:hypothetical protein
MLPNASVVDENYGPPGAFQRKLITAPDRVVAAAITGGGTGCYPPGVRFASSGAVRLIADPKYPTEHEA